MKTRSEFVMLLSLVSSSFFSHCPAAEGAAGPEDSDEVVSHATDGSGLISQ